MTCHTNTTLYFFYLRCSNLNNIYQYCFRCASYTATVHILTCADSNAPLYHMLGADQTVLQQQLTARTAKCVRVATVLKTVNPSTRWVGVVSFTSQLLYSWKRALTILWTGSMVGLTAGLNSLDIPQMYCLLPSHCVDYYDRFP
jgi:hypothetical protein